MSLANDLIVQQPFPAKTKSEFTLLFGSQSYQTEIKAL
jgi:hypothetical protein